MHSIMNFLLKTIFFILLVIVSPLLIFTCLLVFIEDGSPVMFIQRRLGKNKRIFKIYKIRTMLKETPNLGTHEVDESSFLKVGIFFRKTKIDELPQVINFLMGDIDMVGPRPGLPSQKELIAQREKHEIYCIRPGITGLAQVLGYDMENPAKLSQVDSIYIRNKSWYLDCIIFFATFLRFYKLMLIKKFSTELESLK